MEFRRAGRKSGVLIAATALLVAGCAAFGTHPASKGQAPKGQAPKPTTVSHATPTPTASKNLLPVGGSARKVGVAGRFWVGSSTFTITEPAHTNVAGTAIPTRELLMEIRYPLAGRPSKSTKPAQGPLPLIVFAPGFMQCGLHYFDMLKYWAAAGYVVAVVNFPKSDCKTGDAATESDMINQPYDVSYAITALLALSKARHGLFAGLLAPSKIGIAGQSDGGDTVAAVAASACCIDRRVKAVAVESGSEYPTLPGSYFTKTPGPVLFSQGSADVINPPGCSVQMWRDDRNKTRFYLDLFGASHTEPYWGPNRYEEITARVTLAFFDRYVLRQPGQGTVMSKQGNKAHLAALYHAGGGHLALTPCT
jgi:dienelactone hydrolase